MDTLVLAMWSMVLGAVGAVALARAADLVARPGGTPLRALAFHLAVFLLVLVDSGVLAALGQTSPERLRVLQVLAGPVCVGLACLWIHGWLAAAERDRLMAAALRACAFALPPAALALLAVPTEFQLPGAMLLSLAGCSLASWATVRAWTFGDRLALAMAAGCLVTLPAVGGLYQVASAVRPPGAATQAAFALAVVAANALTGRALWRRMLRKWRARTAAAAAPAVDPVTRVHDSAALVHRLVAAQKRRRRTHREGALLAVRVFEPERIVAEAGARGLDEVWVALAARLQRVVGVLNPVGRYWDRCFVAFAETIPAPGWMRTAGLRVACALRQPVTVSGRNGEPVRVRIDFGVGVLHLPVQHGEVEDMLDDVQRLAVAARQLRSRAATLDPSSGRAVALEEADLDRRPQRQPPPARAAPARHGRAH